MNLKKSHTKSKQNKYHSFYFKKIQTQTSSQDLHEISHLLESQIKKLHKSMYKKQTQFNQTIKRKLNIENQQVQERERLKTKIQEKMRKSTQNLLQNRQKSNSSLTNRLKAEKQKIQEIKKLQKTIYNENYEKSKQMSTATEKFFLELQKSKRSHSGESKIQDNLISNRKKKSIILSPISKKKLTPVNSTNLLNQTSIKRQPFYSFLKTPKETIFEKQQKKQQKQEQKEKFLLREHIKKLDLIQQTRKKQKVQVKLPTRTIAKIINKDFNQQDYNSKRKNHQSFIQQSINNKESFSQSYQLKLNDKKQKKQFFLSQSIASGDGILNQQVKQSHKLKLKKVLKQSQNELIRKGNFRYMQKYLQDLLM